MKRARPSSVAPLARHLLPEGEGVLNGAFLRGTGLRRTSVREPLLPRGEGGPKGRMRVSPDEGAP